MNRFVRASIIFVLSFKAFVVSTLKVIAKSINILLCSSLVLLRIVTVFVAVLSLCFNSRGGSFWWILWRSLFPGDLEIKIWILIVSLFFHHWLIPLSFLLHQLIEHCEYYYKRMCQLRKLTIFDSFFKNLIQGQQFHKWISLLILCILRESEFCC